MSHSGFSTAWLRMREPYDRAARSTELVTHFVRSLPAKGPLHLIDLATGLGSGIRYVAPRLGRPHRWTAIDHDALLLEALPDEMTRWITDRARQGLPPVDYKVETATLDLRDLRGLDWRPQGVTTQALLDLVSRDWLVALADWLADRRLPLIAALTVDGRVSWSPADTDDKPVQAAFRTHQHGDRGFGESPGPNAVQELSRLLRSRGYDVLTARADWSIPAGASVMLTEMLDGTARAAVESDSISKPLVRSWHDRRLRQIQAKRLSLSVGHLDLVAIPQTD